MKANDLITCIFLLFALFPLATFAAPAYDEYANESLISDKYTVHIYCKFRPADRYKLLARIKRAPLINFRFPPGADYIACRARVRSDVTGAWSEYSDRQNKNPLLVVPWDKYPPAPASDVAPTADAPPPLPAAPEQAIPRPVVK